MNNPQYDQSITCDSWGNCYSSRWNNWGRWVFVTFVIIGFIMFITMLMFISARKRRRIGQQPLVGTAWLAPKNQHPQWNAQPGPSGPSGYYPPPPPGGDYNHGNFYTPPPYTPNPQFTGTTPDTTHAGAYYAPPPGPPPVHTTGPAYEMTQQPNHQGPAPPVPVNSHPTGTSTHSYVQSNNPFQPPASPPAAHIGPTGKP
ncbi:hypothetical protein FPQ18DRAFT_398053 [Pyronema domesticum]|uniref:Similar to Protein RCR2 acc. no. Q03446 n=1 Tax=Pyronema omphalodes (strain CBS 100304) TaxID=1076935 RepID=U4LF25_PYROM|nr:hypothetical protein FPQ18DRAFT_398053 [Pyronema domesticum]CCX30463.1 Similar to Protein RCR2; acc. no. Q03446 [Pyronema omphalodes CBS 100304]